MLLAKVVHGTIEKLQGHLNKIQCCNTKMLFHYSKFRNIVPQPSNMKEKHSCLRSYLISEF